MVFSLTSPQCSCLSSPFPILCIFFGYCICLCSRPQIHGTNSTVFQNFKLFHSTSQGFLSEDESSATECKNVYSSARRCKKYDRRRQKMWTLTEVMRLVDGIAEYGTGRWTHIKKHLFASSPHRTPIDLRVFLHTLSILINFTLIH